MTKSSSDATARAAFALAAALTTGVALWLLFVTRTILPARDPAHVPLWGGVALGFLAWSALSAWCLARPPRGGPLRAMLIAFALLACLLGGLVAVRTLAGSPAHFEGYLVVMGLLLTAHGATGIAWARAVRTER
jgi:hypothetical protein